MRIEYTFDGGCGPKEPGTNPPREHHCPARWGASTAFAVRVPVLQAQGAVSYQESTRGRQDSAHQ